jgi:(R,R)-butanediol dehydrogenase/meso-butanediol dehydrogenase/diacetyl reductase
MKAAVFEALGQPLSVQDVSDPTPANDEIVVEVGRCGICGSDLHMTEDPIFGVPSGTVLGHEYSGEIVAVGPGVERLKVGDVVTVSPVRGCGHCPRCLAGQQAWCQERRLEGGGYAQYSLASERQCVKLPSVISLEDGALTEPLSVALHGVSLAKMPLGAKVLVIGAGPIGLATAFWARRLGAKQVAVIDLHTYQEQRAYEMGASAFFGKTENLINKVNQAIGGAPDIVFECVGKPGLIEQSIQHVRVKGTVVVLGLCTAPDTFNPFAALHKEVCIQTSAFFEFPEFCTAVDALDSGAVAPHALITDTVSLQSMPDTFEALRQRTTQCKVMVNPRAD